MGQEKPVRLEDSLVKKTVQIAPNMEPVIPHPLQDKEVRKKLAALEKKFGKKPNILIFLMDDVGYGDPGCYGGGQAVGAPSPNMDKLGEEGLILTSAYAQPTCSPTRATILTGRLPMRTGILRPALPGEKGGLDTEITMAQLLSKAGYVTQGVGKWHVGEDVGSQPQNKGFDDFYGFLNCSNEYTAWRDPSFYPEVATDPARTKAVESLPNNLYLVHGVKGKKIENLVEVTIPICKKLDQMWTDYSVKFIRKMAKSDKPFLLYHCTRGCHYDNYPSEEFEGKSPARYPYKDVFCELDQHLGTLVKTLKETGQLENTLIIVTSDNGPEMETWWDSGFTPFRGAKGSTWEGGMRVPCIVYWKGMIKPGRKSDGLFDLSDIFNTSLSLAGAMNLIPKDRYIDSIDQTSFLLSDEGQSNRKAVFYWLMETFSGVRVAEYKMMLAATYPTGDTWNKGGLSGNITIFRYAKMFNLYLDPKEEHDFFIRKLTIASFLQQAQNWHMETFKKYPSNVKNESL
ncbi:MAG: arylsulfatase [Candidatus Eremiobacteraeota bacterium]|nr:arylsulfatase [Candidatus Eremiobacteraeota bacterium]